ncbi:ATP-dependent RNA helicase Dbp5 [Paramicrosporidium saccamoebae]|uniref:RNA helicase n=1 Tax=Paramicrosporidium saccamoebae TaxID=1246581 RepID=A0A2H9TP65_9FUNG|nr:ATP-dependent RNA helicase Dbp5 [Paramicrosporidium saccamoebae]
MRIGENDGWGAAEDMTSDVNTEERRQDNGNGNDNGSGSGWGGRDDGWGSHDNERGDKGNGWGGQDNGRGDKDNGWGGRSDGWGNERNERDERSAPRRGSGNRMDNRTREPVDMEATAKVVDGLMETLQNVNIKLADKQADVNSPLFSVKSFEELGLSPELLKGIYAMKFVKPSKVQEHALPLLLSDPPQNMIAQSQSGTGKTAAFTLTMLKRVDPTLNVPQALCLAPTRELARQILDVIQKMGQFTSVTSALCLREEAPRREPINAHILVGTPGTLLELERRRLVDLSQVRVFVLDEADVMLDKQGMGLQSMRLRKICPEYCQLLLFSATFNGAVIEFAHMIIPNANEITLKREEVSVDSIKQYYIECDSYHHKMEMLSTIYGLLTVGQSIIFIATRNSAEEVKARMEDEGHMVSLIHGGMTPAERDTVIDEFRQGRTRVLLATNVLARGIDVLQVSLVVNFDLPMTPERYPDPETYVHRIGRTGRFGRSGVAINFVHNDLSRQVLRSLEEFFEREIIRMPTESVELLEQKLQSLNRGQTAVPPNPDIPPL